MKKIMLKHKVQKQSTHEIGALKVFDFGKIVDAKFHCKQNKTE